MWIGLKINQADETYSVGSLLYVLGSNGQYGQPMSPDARVIVTAEQSADVKYMLGHFEEPDLAPAKLLLQNNINATPKPFPTNIVCVGIDMPFDATNDELMSAVQTIYTIDTTLSDVNVDGVVTLTLTLLDEVILTPKTDYLGFPAQSFEAVVTMCGDQLISVNNDPLAVEFLGKDTESFTAIVSINNDGKVSSIVRTSPANANLLAIKALVATPTDADKTAIASIKKLQKAGVVISIDDKLLLILKSVALVERVKNNALSGSGDRYQRLRLTGVSAADAVAICDATNAGFDSGPYLAEEMLQIACSSIKNVAKLAAYLESKNVRVPKISPTSEWANALRNDESVMQVIAGAGLKKAVA